MMSKAEISEPTQLDAPEKILTPQAKRALAEAEERRKAQADRERLLAEEREYAGRGGKDPVRYNDWEVKGIASDF
jgi:hypothetical protein